MTSTYSLKANLARCVFALLVVVCWLLYKQNLIDYVILILLAIAFGGIFTTTDTDLKVSEIHIRKSYFWGVFSFRRAVPYDQVVSISTSNYEVETLEYVEHFADSLIDSVVLTFFKPKIQSVTTKLYYLRNEKLKSIELKMSPDNFKNIESRIIPRDDFLTLITK